MKEVHSQTFHVKAQSQIAKHILPDLADSDYKIINDEINENVPQDVAELIDKRDKIRTIEWRMIFNNQAKIVPENDWERESGILLQGDGI